MNSPRRREPILAPLVPAIDPTVLSSFLVGALVPIVVAMFTPIGTWLSARSTGHADRKVAVIQARGSIIAAALAQGIKEPAALAQLADLAEKISDPGLSR